MSETLQERRGTPENIGNFHGKVSEYWNFFIQISQKNQFQAVNLTKKFSIKNFCFQRLSLSCIN